MRLVLPQYITDTVLSTCNQHKTSYKKKIKLVIRWFKPFLFNLQSPVCIVPCGPSPFGPAAFPGSNSCLWLGTGPHRMKGEISESLSWHSRWGWPSSALSPMACALPPSLSVSYKVPTLASLGCLQTLAQGVSLLSLVSDLQLAARTQGLPITSYLPPWARFPWPVYSVTDFLRCADMCFPNCI